MTSFEKWKLLVEKIVCVDVGVNTLETLTLEAFFNTYWFAGIGFTEGFVYVSVAAWFVIIGDGDVVNDDIYIIYIYY